MKDRIYISTNKISLGTNAKNIVKGIILKKE